MTSYAGSSVGRVPVHGGTEAASAAAGGCATVRDAAGRGGEAQGSGQGVAPPVPTSVNVPEVDGSSPSPRTSRRRVLSVARWRWPTLIWRQNLGNPEHPYLTRWVIDLGRFALRLHHWKSSDDLRAPHDHAWDFWSILVWGRLVDRTPGPSGGYRDGWKDTPRRFLRPKFFNAEHRHSVVVGKTGAWTMLITGPERREWGFWTPRKGGPQKGTVRFRNRNKYFWENSHH